MIVCQNINWIQTKNNINNDLFFIDNHQLWEGNSMNFMKRLLHRSKIRFHSFIVIDSKKPLVYLSQVKNIVQYDGLNLTKVNQRGDILNNPYGLLYDNIKKLLYICDTDNHRICVMDNRGNVSTIVGKSRIPGYKNGRGNSVLFRFPTGITFGETKQILYVTDRGNHVIRRIDTSQSYQTTTIGSYQSGKPLVSDGISNTALFREPYDILNFKNQSLLVCEKIGNIREINLHSGVVTTVQLSHPLKTSLTRMYQVQPGILIHNNGDWYLLKHSLVKQTCSTKEKTIHHHGIYFDTFNLNRIIKQPYKFSYYSPQDPQKKKQFTGKWGSLTDYVSQYDYHQAINGNHIPYLSDSRIQDDINDRFMYPNEKTPKLLYVELHFIRYKNQSRGYTYLVETQYGYEGRIRIKHKNFPYPKTHILRLKKNKQKWELLFYPKIGTPLTIEFVGGEESNFESNNVTKHQIGYWEENSELLGDIRQWSELMNDKLPRHKPLNNLYELSCKAPNQCSYSYLEKSNECCPKGSVGNACRKKDTQTYSEKGRCQCKDGTVSDCPIMKGEPKTHKWNHCEKCKPGYEKRNSGICTQKCTCKHGISAKREMCYSPGSEICTRCNPGYQLQSDNTCIRIGNYMGQTTQLQDNTYTVNKPSWGNKFFDWKMKTSNKQRGSGWNPSINQPTNDICLEKKGRYDRRKVILDKKSPLFNLECWNLQPDDPCYQRIQTVIGNKPPQSPEFQKQQCIESVIPSSVCFQKTPCNMHTFQHTMGCMDPNEQMSVFKPLYVDSTILGKSQWSLIQKNQLIQGSELELTIKDYHPGMEIKRANYMCHQSFSPLQQTKQLKVTGLDNQSCSHEELLSNGTYQHLQTNKHNVVFENKQGYQIYLRPNDPCLKSVFGTPCSLNPVIINQKKKQFIKCGKPTIVSSSLHESDCQKCSYWSYIDESNKHSQYDIDKAVFNFSTSSIVPVIHIRFQTPQPSICNHQQLLQDIMEGDFIKSTMFQKTGNKTHIQGIFPVGPDNGLYQRSFQRGIQMILSEGNKYYFEKKVILSNNYPCKQIILPQGTELMLRLSYCNDNHWKITSHGNNVIEIQGDIWDPEQSRSPPTECLITNRQRNPKQLRSILEKMKPSHLLYLTIKYNKQTIATLSNDAITQTTPIELCEPELAFVSPKLKQTNLQVKRDLQTNLMIDTLGYYRKMNNKYYLLNPYSNQDKQELLNRNYEIIKLHSSSKCNQIASETYDPSYGDECLPLTQNDIKQKQNIVKEECIQLWGEQVKHNKKPLFINKQWSPSSKGYQPDILLGEKCCRPDHKRNELTCIVKHDSHKYHVCKDGFHLVDAKEFRQKQLNAKDHTNDTHCQRNHCLCVPNICKCSTKNAPKQGSDCVIHNAESCYDNCFKGTRRINNKCVKNICRCDVSYKGKSNNNEWKQKGELVTRSFPQFASSICEIHGMNSCDQCPKGFYLKGNKCVPFAGECKHGILETQLQRVSDNQCIRCDEDYELTKIRNNKKQIIGTSGACSIVGKEDPPCECSLKSCQNIRPPPHSSMGDCLSTLSSGQNCKFKCDPGFESEGISYCDKGKLHISSCKENICICKNGIRADGDQCLKHNESVCKSCNPGYYLTDQKQCKPYTGVCLNGYPFSQELRTKDNVCEKCKVGYYLEKETCKPFSVCPSGEELVGYSTGGNGIDGKPGKCVSCKNGFYRLQGGFFNTKCKQQPRECNLDEYEKVRGDTKTKRVCEKKQSCIYPTNMTGYIINKELSNISSEGGKPFNVVVQCDTKNNYKPVKKTLAKPCLQNNTEIRLDGCEKGCLITKEQYANTGTCTNILDSKKTCQFKCPQGTAPVIPGITIHRCNNGKLNPGKCSKQAREKMLSKVQQEIEEVQALEDHMETYSLVPPQQSSGSSVPAPFGKARLKIGTP